MGAHRIRRDGLTRPPSSHPIIRRRADPLEPGGSIVGRTKRRGLKATVLSCANGAMTDRLSQCKKLEHGLPGLNLGIRLKPFRTSHCGIASASLACPTGAFTACPAHVVYGYWPRVILVSAPVSSTPTRTRKSRTDARPLRSPRPFGNRRKRAGAGYSGGTPARNSTQKTPQRASTEYEKLVLRMRKLRKDYKTWRQPRVSTEKLPQNTL